MLEIRGDATRINALLTLLGNAAGLTLAMSGNKVTIAGETGLPRSTALRDSLRTMTGTDPRTAKIDVDLVSMPFGVFGSYQKLNVIDAVGFEATATGFGSAVAIHEIWENYSAWPTFGQANYGPAHEHALEKEKEVAQQLTGWTGGRVAAARIKGEIDHREGFALDYETYFTITTPKPEDDWKNGRYGATYHERVELRAEAVDGLAPGERVAAEKITKLVEYLAGHKRATIEVIGQRTTGEARDQAILRAKAMRAALTVGLDEDEYAADTGIELDYDRAKGPGASLAHFRTWASSQDEIADNPGVRIKISEPGPAKA
jgi:hypothetical protein